MQIAPSIAENAVGVTPPLTLRTLIQSRTFSYIHLSSEQTHPCTEHGALQEKQPQKTEKEKERKKKKKGVLIFPT